MRALCLDTSGPTVVVALVDTVARTWSGVAVEARAQSVLQLASGLLGDERAVDAVVVGLGPGGFTGLRVGITTARGLAETWGVPLHGVSSLEIVADELLTANPGVVVRADVDARRGERFVQRLRLRADGTVEALDAAGSVPVAEHGAVASGELAADGAPTVDGLARTALRALADPARTASGDPLAVTPAYVRAPDATPPRMDVRIDQLDTRDLSALVELDRRSFSMPWSESMYAGEFARPADEHIGLAARDVGANGRLVGAALGARVGDSWHLMTMAVDPAARRRGIAARLLDELLQQGEARGEGEGWTLEVRACNAAALALYATRGFEAHGVRPRYYADTQEDAVIMWRVTVPSGLQSAEVRA